MVKDILSESKHIPKALLLAVILAAAYLFLRENRGRVKEKLLQLLKQGWLAAFLFYLAYILTGTIFSRQNTNPYKCILDNFGFRDDVQWNEEIVENILLFIPYVFLYLQAFRPPKPWRSALLLSVSTTAFIELTQLLFWLGSFQLADIVHNILGGMIGYAIWHITMKLRRE